MSSFSRFSPTCRRSQCKASIFYFSFFPRAALSAYTSQSAGYLAQRCLLWRRSVYSVLYAARCWQTLSGRRSCDGYSGLCLSYRECSHCDKVSLLLPPKHPKSAVGDGGVYPVEYQYPVGRYLLYLARYTAAKIAQIVYLKVKILRQIHKC